MRVSWWIIYYYCSNNIIKHPPRLSLSRTPIFMQPSSATPEQITKMQGSQRERDPGERNIWTQPGSLCRWTPWALGKWWTTISYGISGAFLFRVVFLWFLWYHLCLSRIALITTHCWVTSLSLSLDSKSLENHTVYKDEYGLLELG